MADRSLREYRLKRTPERTPEPFGEEPARAAPSAAGMFVVQQHAARRMHWDLRLEINGVLVSWAVPRGPSADPQERRLAVQTEDHPLEYADFEGIIPPGNYGAGAMIVWDRGVYHTVDGEPATAALAAGKLDLEMEGHKLRGRWALVRIKGEGGKSWLLLKKRDAYADTRRAAGGELVVAAPVSILSGLTVDELRADGNRTARLAELARAAGAARRAVDPASLRPMLAETVAQPFSRAGWRFELKYDGVRILAARESADVRLRYRTGRDTTAVFPEIANALVHLACDRFIVDGEVVTLDDAGVPSFERLQKRLGLTGAAAAARAGADIPVVMYCFDLLGLAGYDLRRLPLDRRQELLRQLVPRAGVVRVSDHVEHDGEALFEAAREHGLEGIVAKRTASTYQSGRRSSDWLKIKAQRHADVAVVGYVRGKGARVALGALMVAWRQEGELVYAGNVGTGFDDAGLRGLMARLDGTVRTSPAFRGKPPGPARTHVYVEPRLVATVRYTEVTGAGALRHPVFLGLREDKTVADCDPLPSTGRQPLPAAPAAPAANAVIGGPRRAPSAAPELRLNNLEKVFWPQEGLTKGDLLRYYERIWPLCAPYLRDRPVVLTRYPDGIAGKSFFQKNAPEFTPQWVERCRIEDTDYFVCNTLETLLYVINLGCIPIHVWSARRGSLEHPDWAILDLDPKGAPFEHVVTIARHLHVLLADLGVPHFVKTSGQAGLHVLIPLARRLTHADARSFAEVLARVVADQQSAIATVARPLGARGGKVYIDYLQNGFGKTIVAPFSVRPRPAAPVSTPLPWEAVTRRLDPSRLTMRTVPLRFRRAADPMRGVLGACADVPAALHALADRLK